MQNPSVNTAVPASYKGVDVGKLEKELLAMWADSGKGADSGITRACVLNLVLAVPSDAAMQSIDETLGEVIEHHPCRAQLIKVDSEASEARLDAQVSTRCQISKKGAKAVCGEQVTIEAAGAAVSRLHSVVGPLLLPDIPVFLMWDSRLDMASELFVRLSRLCERVVIDSGRFHKPVEQFAGLARIIHERKKDLRIKDVAWGRMTSWRTVVAGFWDVPEHRASLSRVNRVTIECPPPTSPSEGFSSTALLALGWLASRLEWNMTGVRAKTLGAGALRFDLPGNTPLVSITVRSNAQTQVRGDQLPSLTLASEDGHTYELKVRPCGTKLETTITFPNPGGTPRVLSQVLPCPEEREGQHIARELELLSRDQIYEKTVTTVARLLDARDSAGSVY